MNRSCLCLLRRILVVFCFLSAFVCARGQSTVYVHSRTPVVVHPNASLNIFANVINTGTVISHAGSGINFYGTNWTTTGGGRLPDESATGLDGVGGIYTFYGSIVGAQSILFPTSQPYNGFPNLSVDNQQHVTAQTGNLYVNNNLNFVTGSLILNDVNVNVGRLGKGSITGYSENGFVVTGTGFTGGYLGRSSLGNGGTFVFPVGTSPTSYTPASFKHTGLAQDLKVRVADGVFEKPAFPEYVYKTWELSLDFPDPAATVDMTLQHNTPEEGLTYLRNRNDAYVTRHNRNLTGYWDIVLPSTSVTPGTLTDRTAIGNAYMNTRTGIAKLAQKEYFSKSTIKDFVDVNTPSFIPDAISPNNDGLNDTYRIVKRLPTDVVRLEIFSRNQVLVFRDYDYQNTFDGTGNMGGFMGNRLPDGIYYYLISANNAKGVPGYLIISR